MNPTICVLILLALLGIAGEMDYQDELKRKPLPGVVQG
jgi:hypothetical protein